MSIRCTQADHQNQIIIGFCIDNTCQNQRPYCNFCLPYHSEHLYMLQSLKLLPEWIQQGILRIHHLLKIIQESKVALDSLINFFLPYLNFNIQQFPILGLSQIDKLIKGLCQVESCKEILFKQLKQSIDQIKLTVIRNFNIDNVVQEQPNNQCILKPNLNPFTFELIKQNSIKQNELCLAIAFNKDYQIVVAGCNKDIKVFEHNQGKLNQIQLLCEHKYNVNTLNFMKTTNNFVSGNEDYSIMIWQAIGYNQWYCQQKLNEYSNQIVCLQLNHTDDLIISASRDNTINFWMKQEQWVRLQTITDHSNCVYSLSLNEQQNKLISCSSDQYLLVIEQQKLDKKWSVKQKIKVDQYGLRLCFINDNQFTLQSYCKEQIHLYEMDCNTKQYMKTKEIGVMCGSKSESSLFPQQYLKQNASQ